MHGQLHLPHDSRCRIRGTHHPICQHLRPVPQQLDRQDLIALHLEHLMSPTTGSTPKWEFATALRRERPYICLARVSDAPGPTFCMVIPLDGEPPESIRLAPALAPPQKNHLKATIGVEPQRKPQPMQNRDRCRIPKYSLYARGRITQTDTS